MGLGEISLGELGLGEMGLGEMGQNRNGIGRIGIGRNGRTPSVAGCVAINTGDLVEPARQTHHSDFSFTTLTARTDIYEYSVCHTVLLSCY